MKRTVTNNVRELTNDFDITVCKVCGLR